MVIGPPDVVRRVFSGFECSRCSRRYSFIRKDDYFILVDDSIFVSKSSAICLWCLPNIELIYV